MSDIKSSDYKVFSLFVENLAKKLTKFYYSKLNKKFITSNKIKGKGYDPVTTADKAFEKFIRKEINSKFPNHQIIGEEFGHQKSKSDYTWIIDPIDGTRSFVIGNPTWSNLISINYKGNPIIGLANFPILKKYYYNSSNKNAYLVENKIKKKIKVNQNVKYSKLKMAGAFHGGLSINEQNKIQKILKLMQFPCTDALSYSHFAEGRIDSVIQCSNKIWDIHPLIPIIRAAGGIVTTWSNDDPVKADKILCSANKLIHSKLLKILKPVA